MKQQELIATYRQIITETDAKLKDVKRRIFHIGTLRLILFIAGVAGIIYFWQAGGTVIAGIAAVTFIPFLYLIKLHNQLFYQRDYLEKKIEINQQELQALNHNYSSFGEGKQFVDPSYLYTYDLDVFGTHSLFQYINRTSTEMGERRLAGWLNEHLKDKTSIEKRQEAVKELTKEIKLRQRFRIIGLLHKGTSADTKELETWASAPNYFQKRKWMRILPPLVLAVNALCIGMAIAGVLSLSIAGVIFVSFIILSSTFSKPITQMQTSYGKKLKILTTYAKLIRMIEEHEVQADGLMEIRGKVCDNKGTASQTVAQLSRLMDSLDQRNNIFVACLLNGLFFWELRLMMKIERWKEANASQLPLWLDAIAGMDAYCSLATFAYNHPDYSYPLIHSDAFRMQATGVGHPLMRRTKCVRNDMLMDKRPFFLIVTGANMAGKSTYLRTIGVNYLLSCIGTPVWAERMEIYPAQLVTSLRTSDSLTDNESYFFAELKRLKMIIDKLKRGEELFIILDEILKGTNSIDKQKGSLALIRQFITLRANGVIATHDLLLGSLAEAFPGNIRNHCFEADIRNNELSFSYKMQDGVAQNMNACFLMKKMGIAVADN